MGSTLAAYREQLRAALDVADQPAYDYVPERIVPPVALVLPRTPYVAVQDGTVCSYAVNHRVVLIADLAANETAADALDEAIVRTLNALEDLDVTVESVQEPVEIELNGAAYLGSVALIQGLTEMELT